MHSLGIVQWNSTRRDHPGNLGGVSGSGPVTLNRLNWLGNRICQFIGFNFPKWNFGYFVLFVSVLSHSVS